MVCIFNSFCYNYLFFSTGFHSYGQYSVDASMHTALLSRNMDIKVTPEVWGKVQGSMRVGDAIYALVDIDGSLLNVSLPLTINQNAGSWPLSAGLVNTAWLSSIDNIR